MNKFSGIFLLLLSALICLPGCIFQRARFQPQPLKPLTKESAHFEQAVDGVTVRIKTLSPDDAKATFGNRARYLYRGDNLLMLMQCMIANESEKPVLLTPASLPFVLCKSEEIFGRMRSNTILRSVVLGAVGATVIGIGALSGALMLAMMCPYVGLSLVPACVAVHALPAALAIGMVSVVGAPVIVLVDAAHSRKDNRQLEADLREKMKDGVLTVMPHETINFLVAAPAKDVPSRFAMTLHDAENKDYTYRVVLAS